MRKPIVAGNWKMNGSSDFAKELVGQLDSYVQNLSNVEVVVSPPAIYLAQVVSKSKNIVCAAQNLHDAKSGAYTGETSVSMLQDVGCKYVLIGHSERREMFGDDLAFVAKKVASAVAGGINPVLCVGESLEQRKNGKAFVVVKEQVLSALSGLAFDPDNLVIAYEPIWAIGTGETASPEQAQEIHAYIRQVLVDEISAEAAEKVRILYGGSVSATTAKELFSQRDIDGGLVGGASLKADDFKIICSAAANK
jgi:triosephosphate isomerase